MNSEAVEPISKFTTGHFSTQGTFNTVLLSTAQVSIPDASGTQVPLGAMLDFGSHGRQGKGLDAANKKLPIHYSNTWLGFCSKSAYLWLTTDKTVAEWHRWC